MKPRRWGELAAVLVLAALIVASLRPADPAPPAGPLPTIGPLWILQPLPDTTPYLRTDLDGVSRTWEAASGTGAMDRLRVQVGPHSLVTSLELSRALSAGPAEHASPWPGPPEGLAGFEAFAGLMLGSPESEVLRRLGPPDGLQEGNGRRTCTWFRSCDDQGRVVADPAAPGRLAFQVTFRNGVAVRYFVNVD